jgi:hypothetical protein
LNFQSILPQADPTLASKTDQWKAALTNQSIIIDADTFKGLCKTNFSCSLFLSFVLVECKVYFTHEAFSVDSEINLQVALKYEDRFNHRPKKSLPP